MIILTRRATILDQIGFDLYNDFGQDTPDSAGTNTVVPNSKIPEYIPKKKRRKFPMLSSRQVRAEEKSPQASIMYAVRIAKTISEAAQQIMVDNPNLKPEMEFIIEMSDSIISYPEKGAQL